MVKEHVANFRITCTADRLMSVHTAHAHPHAHLLSGLYIYKLGYRAKGWEVDYRMWTYDPFSCYRSSTSRWCSCTRRTCPAITSRSKTTSNAPTGSSRPSSDSLTVWSLTAAPGRSLTSRHSASSASCCVRPTCAHSRNSSCSSTRSSPSTTYSGRFASPWRSMKWSCVGRRSSNTLAWSRRCDWPQKTTTTRWKTSTLMTACSTTRAPLSWRPWRLAAIVRSGSTTWRRLVLTGRSSSRRIRTTAALSTWRSAAPCDYVGSLSLRVAATSRNSSYTPGCWRHTLSPAITQRTWAAWSTCDSAISSMASSTSACRHSFCQYVRCTCASCKITKRTLCSVKLQCSRRNYIRQNKSIVI